MFQSGVDDQIIVVPAEEIFFREVLARNGWGFFQFLVQLERTGDENTILRCNIQCRSALGRSQDAPFANRVYKRRQVEVINMASLLAAGPDFHQSENTNTLPDLDGHHEFARTYP